MTAAEYLEQLMCRAKKDPKLRQRLLDTRKEDNPLSAFCGVCRELGYPLYEMELIGAGEEFYAAIKRSANGGGENSPLLKGEDDFYGQFFAELEAWDVGSRAK